MFDNLNRPKITIPNLESPKFDDSIFDKYKEVNRLIIIGNGVDLAHGLKTSFKDFIEGYFYIILKNIKNELKHDDPLISITSGVFFEHFTKDFEKFDTKRAFKELRQLMTQRRKREFPRIFINEFEVLN